MEWSTISGMSPGLPLLFCILIKKFWFKFTAIADGHNKDPSDVYAFSF